MADCFWSTNKTGTLSLNLSAERLHVLRCETAPETQNKNHLCDVSTLPSALHTLLTFDPAVEVKRELPRPPIPGGERRPGRWRKACAVNCAAHDGGSQHVRHAAFGSNVSAVIQVTSQLGSWVVVAPYASVTNDNSIIRGKKVQKIWEVYFLTHQQSNDFNGCLKILPIAASLAICQFVLLQVYVSVFPVLCSFLFLKKKKNILRMQMTCCFFFSTKQSKLDPISTSTSHFLFSSLISNQPNPGSCVYFVLAFGCVLRCVALNTRRRSSKSDLAICALV